MNNDLSGRQSQLDFESSAPFFSTPALNGLKQQICHLAQFGGSLIVVEGEAGSGKSVLANKLHSEFSASSSVSGVLPVRLSVPDHENIDSFFSRFCSALGLPIVASSAGESIVVVRSYVQSLVREQKLRLVFIDDADLLSDETLVALLSVVDADNINHGIHLVLTARPGLARDIDRLSSVSLAAYDFSMPNFSPTELERFIEFVLPAEYQALFCEKVVWTAQGMWSKSRGVPGTALALIADSKPIFADAAPSSVDRTQSSTLAEKAPIPFLHAGILIALIGSLIWVMLNNRSDENTLADLPDLTVNKIPLSTSKASDINDQKNVAKGVTKPVLVAENLPQTQGQVRIDDAATIVQEVRSKTAGLDVKASRDVVAPKQIDEKLSTPQQAEVLKKNLEPITSNSSGDRLVTSIDRAKRAVDESSISSSLSKDESFLLSLPSSHYVLQILAASKPDSLQGFIESQPNRRDLRLYQGSREGKAWYVVVIVSFESRADAISAIKSLPPAQSKTGPWAKPISTVVAEIKENRRI